MQVNNKYDQNVFLIKSFFFIYFYLQKKLKDLEMAHSNDAWIKEKENMKRNLDENLKEIKTLNKQCSQYSEQLEKLKKDVRKISYYIH